MADAASSSRRLLGRIRRAQLLPLYLLRFVLRPRDRRSGAPRMLAHLPGYLPEQRAGAETSMAATLRGLAAKGWDISVVVDANGADGEIDGVDVERRPSWRRRLELYRWSDVVVTQLESRNRAIRWSRATGRPLVLFLRMGGVDPTTILAAPDLVVFNAGWLQRASAWRGPSALLRPPIDVDRYRTTPGTAITLVNLNPQKGGPLFFELARRLPELSFLGVRGGWGEQHVEHAPNVTVIDPVDDMREVYGQTSILLMPSVKEALPRVAREAACSGIPVIASPLAGIREAMGDGAIYASLDDPDAWQAAITDLQDPSVWSDWSERSAARGDYWGSVNDLDDLDGRLRHLVHPSTTS